MRICVLANARAVHTERWATALAGRGHEVHVVSINGADIPGATVHRIGFGRRDPRTAPGALMGYIGLLVRFRRTVARLRPDVVHAHYTITHGVIASLSGAVPVVVSAWGTDVRTPPGRVRGSLHAVVNRRALLAATAVTATSRWIRDRITELTGGKVAATVVPFGVDTDLFSPSRRDPTAPYTIVIAKSLKPRYGHDVLIDALSGVVEQIPDARLLVAGGGPQRDRLMDRVRSLGLSGRVEFRGPVDHRDVPALLSEADVLANPSREESFGVAILEASASGLPVVATDVEGVPEVLIDGETGILVPAGDAGALAAALIRLGNDPDWRSQLGSAGRRMVEATYRWERSVDAMEAVLSAAAATRGNAARNRAARRIDDVARRLKERSATDRFVRRPLRRIWDLATGTLLAARARIKGPLATLSLEGTSVTVDTRDGAIGRRLYLMRVYEAAERAVAGRLIRPGMTILDVGAHIGYHTLHFSRLTGPAGLVLAVEAHPDNFALLKRNILDNGAGNVVPFHGALADRAGVMRLAVESANSGMHHIVFGGDGGEHTIEVKTTTLDRLLTEHGLEPEFVKIDVEGAEVRVLRGATWLTEHAASVTILCEFNPAALIRAGSQPEDLLDLLEASGERSLAVVQPDGGLGTISRLDLLASVPAGRHVNLLARPMVLPEPT